MAHQIRVSKGDVAGMIGPEACAADRHAVTIAFSPGQIEYVAHDHVFVGVVRPHPIDRMNRFVVETFQVDRVRAIDGDFAGIDITAPQSQPDRNLCSDDNGQRKSETESTEVRRHCQTRAFQARDLNWASTI